MSRIPIRIRLTALFVAMLAAVLAALGVFVVEGLRSNLTAEVDRSLTTAAATIATGYRNEGSAEFDDAAQEIIATPGSRNLGAQLVDARGEVVRSVGDGRLGRTVFDAATIASARSGAQFHDSMRIGEQRTHVRAISVPLTVAGRRRTLVTVEPLDAVDSAVRRTLVLLSVGGAVSLLLAGFGAWAVAGRALRPVERMTIRAGAIDIDDLAQRVPVPPARDELNRLATTFNAMLGRLRDGVESRERLIADASHELRAPLAAMRAELDVSLRHDGLDDSARGVLERVRDEATRMSRIVDNLLTLARIDEGKLELLVVRSDLTEIARRSVRAQTARLDAAGLRFEAGGVHAPVECDVDRISQVVDNLVDNAIRHSPPGGLIRVNVTAANGRASLEVRDDGPGVAAEHRERIFERFARVDVARGRDGGAGLGLAISREIVRAHGGRLELAERGDGSSRTAFVMSLPSAPDA